VVRLIAGRWRGRRLPVPDRPGLRPTPDRVRQTLFDWLMHRAGGSLEGWCVADLFAGTGAVGLEAASRGASSVTLVEADASLSAALRDTIGRLGASGVTVHRGDALAWLRTAAPSSLDLIFVDPPFASGLHEAALAAAAPHLRPGRYLALESPQPPDEAAVQRLGLRIDRHLRAGAVHLQLLQRLEPATAGDVDAPPATAGDVDAPAAARIGPPA
jgi:16S rRNA (guanine(966)-N(2))-methyltransferase RsmD